MNGEQLKLNSWYIWCIRKLDPTTGITTDRTMALYNQDSSLHSSLLASSSHNCPLWWRTRQTPALESQTQCRSCRSRPCRWRGTCTCFHTLSYILKFNIMKQKQPRWCQKVVLPFGEVVLLGPDKSWEICVTIHVVLCMEAWPSTFV